MNEVDMGSVGTFNFPNFLNMMLRMEMGSSIDKSLDMSWIILVKKWKRKKLKV